MDPDVEQVLQTLLESIANEKKSIISYLQCYIV